MRGRNVDRERQELRSRVDVGTAQGGAAAGRRGQAGAGKAGKGVPVVGQKAALPQEPLDATEARLDPRSVKGGIFRVPAPAPPPPPPTIAARLRIRATALGHRRCRLRCCRLLTGGA